MPDERQANDDSQDKQDQAVLPPADRESPPGARMTEIELSDIVHGLAQRLHLPWLLKYHARTPIVAVFGLVNGFISIALLSLLAFITHSPFVFPSLGPTAFLLFFNPTTRPASPRNTIIGHLIGILAGYFSLVVTGLTNAPPALSTGITVPRIIAAALALGLTSGLMVLLNTPHPPAGATTLIVALSIISKPLDLVYIMVAVVILVVQAWLINHLADIPYPLWSIPQRKKTSQKSG
ncbi:MAG TPA: HPP family protein [Ktedonobacteraceae bacterium]|nr:HPP family protein [Ktedonobacteraceae bacterium]